MESADVLEESEESEELDPRIQVELENLNTATDEINKLEIELDEANTTFRMLLNESTRRLKLLAKKLGSCIERARPYYEAVEVAKKAQLECQKAAVLFQRANEIHAAAKETVALAEQRFMSNQHEWQFDNAWQEMLNHATIKVMDAENQKAASGREHQMRATLFTAAEQKVQQLEERLRRHIIKSRPYFEEKAICQDQLNTQKERIVSLQQSVTQVKFAYSQSLKKLECISEEIHQKRRKFQKLPTDDEIPSGPREPGVGADNATDQDTRNSKPSLPDISFELDRCDIHSRGSLSAPASSAVSEKDETEEDYEEESELSHLKQRVKQLAIRPVYGGEGCSSDHIWESELNATVDKLDHMLLMKECAQQLNDHYKHNLQPLKTPENNLKLQTPLDRSADLNESPGEDSAALAAGDQSGKILARTNAGSYNLEESNRDLEKTRFDRPKDNKLVGHSEQVATAKVASLQLDEPTKKDLIEESNQESGLRLKDSSKLAKPEGLQIRNLEKSKLEPELNRLKLTGYSEQFLNLQLKERTRKDSPEESNQESGLSRLKDSSKLEKIEGLQIPSGDLEKRSLNRLILAGNSEQVNQATLKVESLQLDESTKKKLIEESNQESGLSRLKDPLKLAGNEGLKIQAGTKFESSRLDESARRDLDPKSGLSQLKDRSKMAGNEGRKIQSVSLNDLNELVRESNLKSELQRLNCKMAGNEIQKIQARKKIESFNVDESPSEKLVDESNLDSLKDHSKMAGNESHNLKSKLQHLDDSLCKITETKVKREKLGEESEPQPIEELKDCEVTKSNLERFTNQKGSDVKSELQQLSDRCKMAGNDDLKVQSEKNVRSVMSHEESTNLGKSNLKSSNLQEEQS